MFKSKAPSGLMDARTAEIARAAGLASQAQVSTHIHSYI